MKDLIAKLHLDANCALGAIWMHIDAQAARIAELEQRLLLAAEKFMTEDDPKPSNLQAAILAIPHDADYADPCKQYAFDAGFKLALQAAADLAASTALQAPLSEVPEGMPVTQEPKYGIRDNRLFNRASGEVIPEDEPVFIFRARDTHAINILAGYAREVSNAEHASAVWGRVDDFKRFWDANPDRMRQPDTALPAAPVQEPKP